MVKEPTLLCQNTVTRLSDMIFVQKKYMPNSKLPSERALAEELGVSRTSIREAVKILVAQGVLVIRRGLGTFVADNPGIITDPFGLSYLENKIELLRNLFELRLIIEPEAVRLVVERATDDEIHQIILCEQHAANAMKCNENFIDYDIKFHAAIARATHNEVIERFVPSIQQSVYEAITTAERAGRLSASSENALRYHAEISRFLKIRDAAGAMLAMRYHLLRGVEDLNDGSNA